MGELHLEIYVERIRREFSVEVEVGAPRGQLPRGAHAGRRVQLHGTRSRPAARASSPTSSAAWSRCPTTPKRVFVFEDEVIGGRIPKQYIPAIEKGFRKAIAKGPIAGYPVVGLKVIVEDGSYHEVDSSDMAFQICARTAMRENFSRTKPGAAGAGDEDRDRVPQASSRDRWWAI